MRLVSALPLDSVDLPKDLERGIRISVDPNAPSFFPYLVRIDLMESIADDISEPFGSVSKLKVDSPTRMLIVILSIYVTSGQGVSIGAPVFDPSDSVGLCEKCQCPGEASVTKRYPIPPEFLLDLVPISGYPSPFCP